MTTQPLATTTRPVLNEDWLSVVLGIAIFALAIGSFLGVDLLGWSVTTSVWTDVSKALAPATKAYAALGGEGALLATFVAILMALAGVTYNPRDTMRPVSGIDQLINGLSGKFLSSIVALILSVVFTLLEKKICDRQLRNSYDALTRRCRDVFPFLTQSRILLDIQRIAVAQSQRANAEQRAAAAERG